MEAAMRHPAARVRTAQKGPGGSPDYHKMKGKVNAQKNLNNKNIGKKKSCGYPSDIPSLRADMGKDKG